ncbi:TonB-dependent receptor plug domain-containing protein [Burkholderiaceae bacterium UC74_6]
MPRLFLLFLLFLLALLPLWGHAQAPAAAPAPARAPLAASAPAAAASAVLDRVVVTGEADTDETIRRKQNIAMSVYGREELDRQGDIDVTDVLKRLPGVSMEGGAPRLRGLGGGYTQILINGEPLPPGFSIDSLSPADLERIEIIKGATAEFPGVAGTLNLVLREPPKTRSREWRANLGYRSLQPTAGTTLQYGDRVGDLGFVLPFTLSRGAQETHYWGERHSRDSLDVPQAQGILGHDEGRSTNAQFGPRFQWKLSEDDKLNGGLFLQANRAVSRGDRHIDSLAGTPWLTTDDGSETETHAQVRRANLQWLRNFGKDGTRMELRASWQDTLRESEGHYLGLDVNDTPTVQRDSHTDFADHRGAAAGRWNQPVGEDHTLTLGWDAETRSRHELRRVWEWGVEQFNSTAGTPFDARIHRLAVFVQDQFNLGEHWGLLPGLRVEEVHSLSRNPQDQLANRARVVAPTFNLNYRFDPKGRDQIRAALSHSFKLPDLGLLMARYQVNGNYESNVPNTPIAADRAGNPRLQPEQSQGFDLAYEHYPAGGGIVSVGVFYRRIQDLIRNRIALEDDPAPGVVSVPRWVSRPDNFGAAFTRGLELEYKGQGAQLLPQVFDASGEVNLRAGLHIYRSAVEQVDGPDNRLEAQPPWNASMGFDARIPDSRWSWGVSLVLQPGYWTRQTDLQLAGRSSQRALDLFAAWKPDRFTQVRIALGNVLARDVVSSAAVTDLDGFTAGSTTRREGLRAFNLSMVLRLP